MSARPTATGAATTPGDPRARIDPADDRGESIEVVVILCVLICSAVFLAFILDVLVRR